MIWCPSCLSVVPCDDYTVWLHRCLSLARHVCPVRWFGDNAAFQRRFAIDVNWLGYRFFELHIFFALLRFESFAMPKCCHRLRWCSYRNEASIHVDVSIFADVDISPWMYTKKKDTFIIQIEIKITIHWNVSRVRGQVYLFTLFIRSLGLSLKVWEKTMDKSYLARINYDNLKIIGWTTDFTLSVFIMCRLIVF